MLTKTLGQVGLLIDEHFGWHNITEWQKCWRQVVVTELLRQVVNEQIGSLRTFYLPPRWTPWRWTGTRYGCRTTACCMASTSTKWKAWKQLIFSFNFVMLILNHVEGKVQKYGHHENRNKKRRQLLPMKNKTWLSLYRSYISNNSSATYVHMCLFTSHQSSIKVVITYLFQLPFNKSQQLTFNSCWIVQIPQKYTSTNQITCCHLQLVYRFILFSQHGPGIIHRLFTSPFLFLHPFLIHPQPYISTWSSFCGSYTFGNSSTTYETGF